jgi:hypothetical protein
VKRIQRRVEFFQFCRLVLLGLPAGQHPLQRRLRGVIDASHFRSHANFLDQLPRGQIQVQPQAQLVSVQIVDGFHRRSRIVAFPPPKLAHVSPVLLLHVGVVVFLVGTSARELDILLRAPTLQMPVRHPPRSGWLDEWGRLKGGRPV